MAAPLEFYFDFSSPYGYFAAEMIEPLAAKHGRTVLWKPTLLGAVFKVTGGAPLPTIPLKGDYAKKDIPRSARFHGLPFVFPAAFPVSTVHAARAFWWLVDGNAEGAKQLARALYRAYFVENVNISDPEAVIAVAAKQGLVADDVRNGINDTRTKERVKAEVDLAIAKGAFGSPFVIADGEPFWGVDRFDQLERFLASGAW